MLGIRWPVMGVIVGVGALTYMTVCIGLTLGYVAPAARLSNRLDTRIGGALSKNSLADQRMRTDVGAEISHLEALSEAPLSISDAAKPLLTPL
jgi:ATP-binding cassette subfamily B protein